MDILFVDTDLDSYEAISESVSMAYPDAQLHSFVDPLLALKYGINNPISLLITTVKMRGVDGPHLTKLLRKVHPEIKVIFVNQGPLRRREDLNAMPDAVLELPVTAEAFTNISDEWCIL